MTLTSLVASAGRGAGPPWWGGLVPYSWRNPTCVNPFLGSGANVTSTLSVKMRESISLCEDLSMGGKVRTNHNATPGDVHHHNLPTRSFSNDTNTLHVTVPWDDENAFATSLQAKCAKRKFNDISTGSFSIAKRGGYRSAASGTCESGVMQSMFVR